MTRRAPVLLELVHADLECRLKAGEGTRAEDYLRRYPELAAEPAVAPPSVPALTSLTGEGQRPLGGGRCLVDAIGKEAGLTEQCEDSCLLHQEPSGLDLQRGRSHGPVLVCGCS